MMGVLETRNIDFDHVLLLSCNEGNLPKGLSDTSFIPYTIRKAYGLTTIDHKVAIYAYYFHRLLQRASDITLVYNNSTNDGQTGEMSRFMLQMMVESGHQIHIQALHAGQAPIQRTLQPIIKTDAVMQLLRKYFEENGLKLITLQGELCAPGIQQNRLRLTRPEWYVFTIRINGKRMGLRKMQEICDSLGLMMVPVEEVGMDLPSKYPTVEAFGAVVLFYELLEVVAVLSVLIPYGTLFLVLQPQVEKICLATGLGKTFIHRLIIRHYGNVLPYDVFWRIYESFDFLRRHLFQRFEILTGILETIHDKGNGAVADTIPVSAVIKRYAALSHIYDA
jgi:hypothetical protein